MMLRILVDNESMIVIVMKLLMLSNYYMHNVLSEKRMIFSKL